MKTRRFSACLVLVALLLVLVPMASGAAPDGGLFSPAAAGDIDPTGGSAVIRARFVNAHLELLGDLNAPAERVVLNLFDDAVFTAVFERTETNYLGSFVWVGGLEGIALSNAILAVTDGVLAGNILMPGAIYEVRYAGNGAYAVREIDQAAIPAELEPASVGGDEGARAGAPAAPAAPAQDPCNQIMVLVAYSTNARTDAGGVPQINAEITAAVADANQTYINSGINNRLILVGTMEVTDATDHVENDLNYVTNTSDGIMDGVHPQRDALYADEVALLVHDDTSGWAGYAWVDSTAATAFAVIDHRWATSNHSFAHELGHNMGAEHDWFMEDTMTPGYDKGFVNLTDTWRTVMAYNDWCDCSDEASPCPERASRTTPGSPSCTRLQYWSNPDVTYGGDAMGVVTTGPSNCVAGSYTPDPATCRADNRTRLNNTCDAVANFRTWPTAVELADFAPSQRPTLLVWGIGVLAGVVMLAGAALVVGKRRKRV